MASDGDFGGKGTLELEAILNGVDESIAKLGNYNEYADDASKASEKLERDLAKASSAFRGAATSMDAANGSARKYAEGFGEMRSEVDDLTESLRELAQLSVVEGGRDPLGAASATMGLDQAREVIAVLEAEGITASQVARQVVRAEEQKQAALRETADTIRRHVDHQNDLRQSANLAGAQWNNERLNEEEAGARASELVAFRADIENREQQLRAYGDFRAQQTRQHLDRERTAREQELASFRAAIMERRKIEEAAQRENAASARAYQQAFTDPRSFMGQANSREASLGLKASETSWATEELQRLNDEANDSATVALPRLRYALYDVATTAGIMSAAIAASGGAILATSASYERSFTNVERTTLASADATELLKGQLLGLTREIPESWGFVTEIASIGAQLDIAEEDLASFTETTTKFSTVTGVSAETSAMAFGSLGQLLGVTASEYENMGSAIAYVGVTSVATDEEIIKMSQRLAASAENAGMTAQEVIALSGAFASLRIAPERAQGVMEVYFKKLNTAIAEGGDRLNAFARYSNMSAEGVAEMVANNPAGYFRELALGLSSLDSVSATLALDELGLSGIRAGEVFTRVSGNLEVFDQALANSNQAWTDGTHLASAYGMVVDDLASKWQIFLNAVAEAGAAVGDAVAPAAKAALDILAGLFQQLSEFARSPFGSWVLAWIVTPLTAMVGILAAVVGGSAMALAALAAFATAAREVSIATGGATLSLGALSGAFSTVALQAGMTERAVRGLSLAIGIASAATAAAAIFTIGLSMLDFRDATQQANDTLGEFVINSGGMMAAIQADTAAYNEAAAAGVEGLAEKYTALTPAIDGNSSSLEGNRVAIENAAAILGVAAPTYEDINAAIDGNTQYLGENTLAWFRNQLMQSEAFQGLFQDSDFVDAWMAIGFDFDAAVKASAEGGREALASYYIELAYAAFTSGEVTLQQISAISDDLANEVLRMQSIAKGVQLTSQQLTQFEMSRKNLMSGKGGGLTIGAVKDFEKFTRLITGAGNQARALAGQVSSVNKPLRDGADGARNFANRVRNAGGAAERASRQVRTLKDYASDLEKVWGRAFEIRFSGQSTLDQITSGWSKIRKTISDAADAIAKYHAEMASLNADKDTMQYWLMVAENYGDTIRANELRAKIAETDIKLAETQKKLSAEQEKTNKTLNGNSDAAIENRKEMLSLVTGYQAHLAALAASGASEATLRAEAAKLKNEFIAQATQLGYNQAELARYATAFDDVVVAINNVPRGITVDFNADPALQALNEFLAKAQSAAAAAGGGIGSSLGGSMSEAFDASEAEQAGRSWGDAMRTAFVNDIKVPFTQEYTAAVYDSMMSGEISVKEAANKLGYSSEQEFLDHYKTVLPEDLKSNVPIAFWKATDESKKSGSALGSSTASGLNAGFGSSIGLVQPISGAAIAAQTSARSNGATLGSIISEGLRSGISWALNVALGYNTVPRKAIRAVTGFRSGGYTGPGNDWDVNGVVHANEFVWNAQATRNIGPANLAYMHEAAKAGRPITSQASMPRSMEVELSPTDRQLLVDVRNAMGLSIDGTALQGFVGAGAVNSGRRGQG